MNSYMSPQGARCTASPLVIDRHHVRERRRARSAPRRRGPTAPPPRSRGTRRSRAGAARAAPGAPAGGGARPGRVRLRCRPIRPSRRRRPTPRRPPPAARLGRGAGGRLAAWPARPPEGVVAREGEHRERVDQQRRDHEVGAGVREAEVDGHEPHAPVSDWLLGSGFWWSAGAAGPGQSARWPRWPVAMTRSAMLGGQLGELVLEPAAGVGPGQAADGDDRAGAGRPRAPPGRTPAAAGRRTTAAARRGRGCRRRGRGSAPGRR